MKSSTDREIYHETAKSDGMIIYSQQNAENSSKRIGKLVLICLMAILSLFAALAGTYLVSKNREQAKLTAVKDLNNQTSILVGKGNYDEAIKNIQDKGVKDRETALTLVTVYVNKKDYDSAVSTLQEIEKKFGMNTSTAELLAYSYSQKKDYEQAKLYYLKAAELVEQEKGNPISSAEAKSYRKLAEQVQANK